jgi:dihydrofolate synthase/folylpolyglutamate synthase
MNPAQCRAFFKDLERFGIKLGLDNISALLSAVGDPHRAVPAVHVAGTNGKGSVCAMLAEGLRRHGFKVGLYTSPHLVRVEERIRVNDRTIPPADFRRLAGIVKRAGERLAAQKTIEGRPTFFEVLTAIAFLYFREKGVDIEILETGMGGRFDATNVTTPLVSVITSVALDHQEHLGRTVGRIAFEKAGIIKPGIPVVSGAVDPAADDVIRKRAMELKAPFLGVFDKAGRFGARPAKRGMRFSYRIGGTAYSFSPGLRGEHQGRNAAIVLAAASVLIRVWRPLDMNRIVKGIETARWDGRLELVSTRPNVFLDGAHNESGAAALRRFVERTTRRPPVIVFAMMKDKAIGRVARTLFPVAGEVILTSIPYPRAARPEDVLRLARPFAGNAAVQPDLASAIEIAKARAGKTGTVLVTGSLFLVGEAKRVLARRTKERK